MNRKRKSSPPPLVIPLDAKEIYKEMVEDTTPVETTDKEAELMMELASVLNGNKQLCEIIPTDDVSVDCLGRLSVPVEINGDRRKTMSPYTLAFRNNSDTVNGNLVVTFIHTGATEMDGSFRLEMSPVNLANPGLSRFEPLLVGSVSPPPLDQIP